MTMAVIEMRGITRHYGMGETTVRALQGIDLTIEQGESVAIMGPSGSGKSTLMNILGCLDAPTSGSYIIDDIDTRSADMDDFADIRNSKIGFIFQGFNLLPRTSARENVELPLFYNRTDDIDDPRQRAEAALIKVGLGNRLDHIPARLSGGQQQRVAIARALVNDPVFVLADEPTGNLDTGTTLEIMALFRELNEAGITIITVTHEPEVAGFAGRIIILRDGRIFSDKPAPKGKRAEGAAI